MSPTTERTKLTPPQIARRWGIAVDKALCWIRSGELVAMDASTSRTGRPRYLIDVADLERFEAGRRVSADGRSPRRRRVGRGAAQRETEFFS